MIEVFITDIRESFQAKAMKATLQTTFPGVKIDLDLERSGFPFPCGHSVLRTEGLIDTKEIIAAVKASGFRCAVLEDKVCK